MKEFVNALDNAESRDTTFVNENEFVNSLVNPCDRAKTFVNENELIRDLVPLSNFCILSVKLITSVDAREKACAPAVNTPVAKLLNEKKLDIDFVNP